MCRGIYRSSNEITKLNDCYLKLITTTNYSILYLRTRKSHVSICHVCKQSWLVRAKIFDRAYYCSVTHFTWLSKVLLAYYLRSIVNHQTVNVLIRLNFVQQIHLRTNKLQLLLLLAWCAAAALPVRNGPDWRCVLLLSPVHVAVASQSLAVACRRHGNSCCNFIDPNPRHLSTACEQMFLFSCAAVWSVLLRHNDANA